MALKSLFVLFTFCNPTNNLDVGVEGWGFLLACFGEASCFLLLAILANYSGKTIW